MISNVGIIPHSGTQEYTLLIEFHKGRHLTVAESLNTLGIYALSQRVGDLKRLGWDIKSKTVKSNGKRFSEYWVEAPMEELEPVPFLGYV